ncbi:MAG: Asp-tRNA(Asn)/Glu-tRNA(Gln) amidotransferase subunit GatB [Acetobacteraceae bacterium]|nr:Asp-tRNA(Asn)/Glu-tRNA(Gln) amidotransferase subunit GatB [Acetobacteraceae bacterium]
MTSEFEPVIGLEVHVELSTRTKAFCGCPATFGAPPNTQVCPVCLGLPGSLPVLNLKAVEYAIRAALALGCQVARVCKFDRKNYFYPDLPKSYQISQYDLPLATGGAVEFLTPGGRKRVGIRRLHLEEDTGKLLHEGVESGSLVDFNRCGVPLLEIVSEPELASPEDARLYLTALRSLIQFTGVSDCRMERGSLRCDANVSLRPRGSREWGALVEVKNMNSFRSVKAALEFEVSRQARVLSAGGRVARETRHWDEARGVTFPSRSKEEAHDYRYFPEPDLPPLRIEPEWVEEIRAGLPELPEARRRRLVSGLGLPEYNAWVLTSSPALARLFDETLRLYPDPREVSNWVMGDVLRVLNARRLELEESKLTAEGLAGMLRLIDRGLISGRAAKALLEALVVDGGEPARLVEELGLTQVSDPAALAGVVREVVAQNPSTVADYLSGKEKALTFLMGQVMKRTSGRANPEVAARLLRDAMAGEGRAGSGAGPDSGGEAGGR